MMTDDFTGALRAPAVFDSGHTLEQIDAILEQLIDELERSELGRDAGLIVGFEVGLLSGDAVQTSQAGMVMLPEPWSVIKARLQTVRNEVARGASLNEAIELANRRGGASRRG